MTVAEEIGLAVIAALEAHGELHLEIHNDKAEGAMVNVCCVDVGISGGLTWREVMYRKFDQKKADRLEVVDATLRGLKKFV